MSCSCDGCYYGYDCEKVEVEIVEEVIQDDETYDDDDKKPCPGYTTSLYVYQCATRIEWDEHICESCLDERNRLLDLEDQALEALERRQAAFEEEQLMKRYGDFDDNFSYGDSDGDVDGDKQKRNF